MQNKVITISRQYGSGGREIGACLAKSLNLPFYDKELIALSAAQSGLSGNFFKEPERGDFLFRDFFCGTVFEPSLNDKVYFAQCLAIRSIAAKGPCIIVGRGAGGILKDTTPLLNIFIYADIKTRMQRAVEEYGYSPHKIKEHIDAIDKKRSAYFKFYSGTNGREMENYHLCIDSGILGIDNTVALIKAAYLSNVKS